MGLCSHSWRADVLNTIQMSVLWSQGAGAGLLTFPCSAPMENVLHFVWSPVDVGSGRTDPELKAGSP